MWKFDYPTMTQKKIQILCNLKNQLSHFHQVLTNVIYNKLQSFVRPWSSSIHKCNFIIWSISSTMLISSIWCDLDLYDQLHPCNVIHVGSFFFHVINVCCVGNEIHIVKFHPCDPIPSELFIPTFIEISSTWFNFM